MLYKCVCVVILPRFCLICVSFIIYFLFHVCSRLLSFIFVCYPFIICVSILSSFSLSLFFSSTNSLHKKENFYSIFIFHFLLLYYFFFSYFLFKISFESKDFEVIFFAQSSLIACMMIPWVRKVYFIFLYLIFGGSFQNYTISSG